ADAKREAAVRSHFDRHLVVRAADSPRLHFEARLDVVDRLLEHLQRIVARLFFDDVETLVNDPLGGAAFPAVHDAVDELADQRTLIDRIRRDITLRNLTSAGHLLNPRIADCGLRIADLLKTVALKSAINPQSSIRNVLSLLG